MHARLKDNFEHGRGLTRRSVRKETGLALAQEGIPLGLKVNKIAAGCKGLQLMSQESRHAKRERAHLGSWVEQGN